jgi:hypothetical protein
MTYQMQKIQEGGETEPLRGEKRNFSNLSFSNQNIKNEKMFVQSGRQEPLHKIEACLGIVAAARHCS